MKPPLRSSKSLHNFTLPNLKWGNQKFLRCIKLQSASDNHHHLHNQSPTIPDQRLESKPINNSSTPPAIEGKKLTLDQRIVQKLKEAVLVEPQQERGGNDTSLVPWNLRKRRAAACKSPRQDVVVKMNEERVKLSVSLSKQEVEEDFIAIVGSRPTRRPKKRPRLVQKQLDAVFPGLWLTEVTADLYKVSDLPE